MGAGKKMASMDRPPIMRAMGTADITVVETNGTPETTSTNGPGGRRFSLAQPSGGQTAETDSGEPNGRAI